MKRVADVVKIFDRIQREMPARLILLGDGPEINHVVSLIDKLGLRDQVTFFGPIEDVENVLPYADLFLLPTGNPGESFGLAALESMACGVPVITTLKGGTPEVIENGVNGFLCEVGKVDCMARVALDALAEPTMLAQMGRAARKTAEKRFPPDAITDQYEAFYLKVLEGD